MKKQHQNFPSRMICFLLILQLLLIGVQGKIKIDEGGSTLEVLIWMINQSIVILQKVSRQKKEQNFDNHKYI
ncbi:hypothetical protein [Nostoc sp. 'Peltigera membranacea cyanobiont' N6]|uniref:hypothetical protein n=1 Tax=Nostoc sp. 'Peltigera membranacea cyanobiont' N6 TaxID=1261031 RepID=UPI000CF336B1|nr:hypothetical protein [Nostoc sp. 'Peltigera membranacea cyanobiont' N6]